MPLWQVQLREWTGGTIKQMQPLETLVDFDQPLTFSLKDENGTLLLAHLVSQDDQHSRYVVAPTTQQIIDQLKSGARAIITALDQPILWLVDVSVDGEVTKAWVGTLKEIPAGVLPASDVMLYAHLAPMIRLRATGKLIEPGSLPARVVKSLVGGAENAVRWLTNYVTAAGKPGRPSESHRSLYQLQAQQFAFRSFEVAFRPVDPASGLLISDENAIRVVREVERLLSVGLQWVQTGELNAKSDAERQAILEAMKELSPPQGSPIERIDVSGRVVSDPNPNNAPRLSKTTRQLAGSAIGEMQKGRELPDYVVQAGRIVQAHYDNRKATVRNSKNEDVEFDFEEAFLGEVMDAFYTQVAVSTVAVRDETGLWLVVIEPLDDASSSSSSNQ
jgi:hypothetical protein